MVFVCRLAAGEGEGGEEEEVTIGKGLAKYLQAHQRAGVKFAWECLVRQGKGCILAHCMGLGKSLQVVALLYGILSDKQVKICRFAVQNVPIF
jgi:SNF2 family DNA or RNA helicase